MRDVSAIGVMLLSVLFGCGGGSTASSTTDAVTEQPSELTIQIDAQTCTVGGRAIALTDDAGSRSSIADAIEAAVKSTSQRVHINSVAGANFGMVAFVVDDVARRTSWTEFSVGTGARYKMRAIPGQEFREPYLVVSPKRERPIAVQCPDPCQPSNVVVVQPSTATIGSVWPKTTVLTANQYTWWLNPDYGNVWREQLAVQKETLGQCVNTVRQRDNIGPIDVSFDFVIGRTGRVEDVTFRAFEPTYQPIYDCVKDAVMTINMPRAHRMDVTFTYSFGASE